MREYGVILLKPEHLLNYEAAVWEDYSVGPCLKSILSLTQTLSPVNYQPEIVQSLRVTRKKASDVWKLAAHPAPPRKLMRTPLSRLATALNPPTATSSHSWLRFGGEQRR